VRSNAASLHAQGCRYRPDFYVLRTINASSRKTTKETFFASQMQYQHRLHYPKIGDFLVDEKYIFEIGGKNKSFKQIQDMKNSFIAADDIEVGFGAKIPLWLFGFLY
jgi:predicted ATP-dependent serine protease